MVIVMSKVSGIMKKIVVGSNITHCSVKSPFWAELIDCENKYVVLQVMHLSGDTIIVEYIKK